MLKNWCFWTMVLEKTFERPLDCKEIKPVNTKGNQPWIFTEGLMLKLNFQYLDYLMQRADTLERPDVGKDWRQKEKRVVKDEMVRQYHQLNGHESAQTPRVSEGLRSLACYSQQGCKESDTTSQLNNKNESEKVVFISSAVVVFCCLILFLKFCFYIKVCP